MQLVRSEAERRAAASIGGGAVLTVLGILLGATVARLPGGLVLLVGWLLLIRGLHVFGRLGPTESGEG